MVPGNKPVNILFILEFVENNVWEPFGPLVGVGIATYCHALTKFLTLSQENFALVCNKLEYSIDVAEGAEQVEALIVNVKQILAPVELRWYGEEITII